MSFLRKLNYKISYLTKIRANYAIVAEKKQIEDYEIVDHGVQHSQYFQGCGTSHTGYDEVYTGIGDSQKEALEDAAEQLASDGWELSKDLKNEISKANDTDEVTKLINEEKPDAEFTVTHHSNAMGSYLTKETFDSMEDAQAYVKQLINKLKKKKLNVEILEENEWEVTEPNDAYMVPDEAGIISITDNDEEIEKFEDESADAEIYYYISIRVK